MTVLANELSCESYVDGATIFLSLWGENCIARVDSLKFHKKDLNALRDAETTDGIQIVCAQ